MQMFRTIILLFVCNFFATTAFAGTTHVLSQGIGLDYELPPQNPQVMVNFLFAPIKATCTIVSDSLENPLEITMLKKSGVLNGSKLKQGESVEFLVQNGDVFVFTIESGAKVQLLNKGEEKIRANCSAT